MIVIQISGGIGNQLFQYFYAKRLKKCFNKKKIFLENGFYNNQPKDLDKRKYELSNFENIEFQIVEDFFFKKFQSFDSKIKKRLWYIYRIIFKPSVSYFIIKDNSWVITKLISNFYQNIYFMGSWQSQFVKTADYVNFLKELSIKPKIQNLYINRKWINIINKKKSVAVCVRRSDYVKIGSSSDKGFYEESIKVFNSKFLDINFFFFSDDIPWCKEQFGHLKNTYFVDKNDSFPFENILLIGKCNHSIISKSTFDWWGSSLISNPNRIIIIDSDWKLNNLDGMILIKDLRK